MDLISRQAAIDEVINWLKDRMSDGKNGKPLTDRIKDLPPVQPERQKGEWVPHETPDGGVQYECSKCGVLWEFNDGTPEDNEAYFCPKCGTKMTISTK